MVWFVYPVVYTLQQSCQAVNVSKMQINTKQWNKWILVGIMAGSCATDVGLVFEKCRLGHVLTLDATQLWFKDEKPNHKLGDLALGFMHSYQTVSIIFIFFFFSIDIDTARLTFPSADVLQADRGCRNTTCFMKLPSKWPIQTRD